VLVLMPPMISSLSCVHWLYRDAVRGGE
jgi:hypothetical protein